MDEHYDIHCSVCETHSEVIVDGNVGIEPEFCPMCGSPVEPE